MWEFLKDPMTIGLLACMAFVALWWAALEWPDRARATLRAALDAGRASPLLLVFAATFLAVAAMNPAKAGLALWGVSKIALGGYVGYWADRLCFRPEDRPHRLVGIAQGTAWKRRALIIAAAILAGGLIP
jgi:hypothetical protein